MEDDRAPQGDTERQSRGRRPAVFFDGRALRPEAAAYRVAVKKDSTLGHVRELTRDLYHLERTIAERPPLVASERARRGRREGARARRRGGSLAADRPFEEHGRALTGRALALAAALDWPAAAAEAAAVLDDAMRRTPLGADATGGARQRLLLEGEPDKAV